MSLPRGRRTFAQVVEADGGYASHCVLPTHCLIHSQTRLVSCRCRRHGRGPDIPSRYCGYRRAASRQRIGIVGIGGLGMTGARIAVVNGAEVYGAEPRKEAWGAARKQGVWLIVETCASWRSSIGPHCRFRGIRRNDSEAISVVRRGGLIVQVGLGPTQATISTFDLIGRGVGSEGSGGGGRRTPPLCSDI